MRPIPFLTVRLPDPDAVADAYSAIFARGIFTNCGPVEHEFAAALSQWIGNDVAVSVTSNATASIQLACRALFHHERRHVVVASFTSPAGPLAVRWAGFEPLFVDITPGSWQPDEAEAEHLLGAEPDIAGILLTSTFGTAVAAIERWEDLARRHGLPLVIDSAPGFGSEYPWGEPLGARGDCEIFSFHATKLLAIGEGGAVVARDHGLIERFDRLKNYGFDADRRSLDVGLNAKLPELSSAIGLRQLDGLAARLARRRAVMGWYAKTLEPLGCEMQDGADGAAPPFFATLLPADTPRAEVGDALTRAQIGWRTYFDPPVHAHPSFAGARTYGDLPVTNEVSRRILSLPLDDDMAQADVERVAATIAAVLLG